MRDEVLQKALTTDSTIIPRYDIVRPDGTKVAENVQLTLKNPIATAGTPLNKQSLLKDATAVAYGLSGQTALPDDVLLAIRRSASYCPKLKVFSKPYTLVYVQNVAASTSTTYSVPASGEVMVDILSYGTYKIWGNLDGIITTSKYIDIYSTELHVVDIGTFVTYCKVTVEEEVGATITARHSDGTVAQGNVRADKTCILTLRKTGSWFITGRYNECDSNTATLTVEATMHDTTIDKTVVWTKVNVNIDPGSNVVLTKDGISRSGVSNIEYTCMIWLPSAGNWEARATLGDKVATMTAYAQQNQTVPLSMRYA